jgi:hypothetical protein
MSHPLSSTAEIKAAEARGLPSFSRFNLAGAKNDLEILLRQIGRNGIFAEYTNHDISHIDSLLAILEWLVVPEAAASMSPADWMMIVLAIYLHDAGLVVTKAEFDERSSSGFPVFRDKILNSTAPSAYQEHVRLLPDDERERFLYQEFVRIHHAERIKRWINGEPYRDLGAADQAAKASADLVRNLSEEFRGDLALVCESHLRDDLDDLKKYDPRRPYGNDLKETANLQFAAILLRTADLLHITQDRAPSLAFSLINPSDPKSIEEWHKQMTVVTTRMSQPRDRDGNVDIGATPDTIAVTATFHDPLGYFSLSEYLFYADKQLKQSNQWAEQTNSKEALRFNFPWRKIDSTRVKAEGFESKQFSFELDKPKILKLLTGHTLYSNSDVVVRELVQNSLDATRLQSQKEGSVGRIELTFSTASRMLTVDDNGTGMTQSVIENHFLNVGNSRYSDETFRKQNPGFSAISRFGIGILSTFMISDEIEVITKVPEEKQARNLSIRSLNGKYLIRLLDPNEEGFPELLRTHGTRVQLKVRAGVEIPDIKQIAEFWILFPECELTVKIDNSPKVRIGFESPRQALEETLRRAGYNLSSAEPEEYVQAYRVVEKQRDGLRVAFALQWQPAYKNWAFASPGRVLVNQPGQPQMPPNAVCVHGVRVESTSPGFAGQDPLAICDIKGPKSPATNVARSNLESGVLVDEMFSKIYEIYAGHITGEIHEMSTKRGLSTSTAASEGRHLSGSLRQPIPENQCPGAGKLLSKQLKTIPCLTLDKADKRSLVSPAELDREEGFWTVEGGAYSSAEEFLKRTPSGVSLAKLVSLLGADNLTPHGSVLGGYAESTLVRELILDDFEVDRIEFVKPARQANLHWRALSEARIWKSIIPSTPIANQRVSLLVQQFGRIAGGSVPRFRALVIQDSDDLCVSGLNGECGLMGAARSYVFRGNQIHTLISKTLADFENGEIDAASYAFTVIMFNYLLSDQTYSTDENRLRTAENVRQNLVQTGQIRIDEMPLSAELREIIMHPPASMFDPMRGERLSTYGPYLNSGLTID